MPFKVRLSSKPIKYQAKNYEVGRDRIFTINKSRFSQSPHPLVSFDANSCTMLNLNGGNNRNCLMHLSPEQQSTKTLKSGLEKCLLQLHEKMGNLEEDIRGIIVGGRHSEHKDSFNLFNEIANILDEFGIPFSMLCGKFDNIANDNIVITGNKACIWNSSLDNNNNNLEDIYEVVEISDEVPVNFE